MAETKSSELETASWRRLRSKKREKSKNILGTHYLPDSMRKLSYTLFVPSSQQFCVIGTVMNLMFCVRKQNFRLITCSRIYTISGRARI